MNKTFLFIIALLSFSFANAQYEWDAPKETKAKYNVINPMINNTISVKLGNKWGVVDESDKTILPFKYDFIRDVVDADWIFGTYNPNIVTVKLGNKWGVINRTNGETVIPIKYDTIGIFLGGGGGFAPAKFKNKWGFFDKQGKNTIPLLYDSVGYFARPNESGYASDCAAVKQNGKLGFIDKTGKVVYPFIIDLVQFYTNYPDDPVAFLINGKWIEMRDMKIDNYN